MENRPDSTVKHPKLKKDECFSGFLPEFNSKNIKWRSPLINSPNIRHSPKNQNNVYNIFEKNNDDANARQPDLQRSSNYPRPFGCQTANFIYSSKRNPKNIIKQKVAFPLSDQEFAEEEINSSKQDNELSEFCDLESFGLTKSGTSRGEVNTSSSSVGKYYTRLLQTQPNQTKKDEQKPEKTTPEEVTHLRGFTSEVDMQRREPSERVLPLRHSSQAPPRNNLPPELTQREIPSRQELEFSQRSADFDAGFRLPVESYRHSCRSQPYMSPNPRRYSPYLPTPCHHHPYKCCSHNDPYLNHYQPKPYWDPMRENIRRTRGYPIYYGPEPPEDIRPVRSFSEYCAPEPHYVRPEEGFCAGATHNDLGRSCFKENINPYEHHVPERFNYRPTFLDFPEQREFSSRHNMESPFASTYRQSAQRKPLLHVNSFEERLDNLLVPSPMNAASSYSGLRAPSDTRLFRDRQWNMDEQWSNDKFTFNGGIASE
ncbi:uncharacterized protein LOC126736465 isoform X2 [Anthonomus grandis grandis]|nr:uncharacterized protein LOC126736465 isoform X2 [Anthonomus grandis grandis]XP_050296800.1 uncharacterized protein LOC126736465 isoform X2 [Anthonomus grandis grandis]